MSDIASYITGLRARGIAATDLDDTAVTAIIAEALSEYSRYRPLVLDRTFDTIADQQKYTPTEMGDVGIVTVLLCLWNPYQTGDEWDASRTLATLGVPNEAGYWHLPSLDIVQQIKSAAWANNYGGKGYQNDSEGGSLYLTPLPDSAGDKVYILYTKAHSAVTAILSVDRDIWLDLLESYCCERIAAEVDAKGTGGRVRTPEYEIEVATKVAHWEGRAQKKRDRFIQKCQAGFAACGRT